MSKFYKIVNDDFSSAYVGDETVRDSMGEELPVTYKINEWVKPKIPNSNLMVFSSVEDAKNWIARCGWGTRLFTCEVLNPSDKGIMLNTGLALPNMLKKYVNGIYTQIEKEMYSINPPNGTVFCDAVMLLEEIPF